MQVKCLEYCLGKLLVLVVIMSTSIIIITTLIYYAFTIPNHKVTKVGTSTSGTPDLFRLCSGPMLLAEIR